LFLILVPLYIRGKLYASEQPPVVKLSGISDTLRIINDLTFLTNECRYRNYHHPDMLNKSGDYIKKQFQEISSRIDEQKFYVNNEEFRNIICSLGPENGERIIIGAHYDVCMDQDGADDNASGIAGLIELARLLKDSQLKYRIDFVAYSLEEPPFFKSENMGSYVHAKSLSENNVPVKGMICLEMIGYYSKATNSQRYPLFFLRWFYGNKGDYITVVQKYRKGSFGRDISQSMMKDQVIITKRFSGPKWLPGVDYSDHLNYWKFGYNALMITNTAFYRNRNYHKPGDRLETLNVGNIGLVVDELYRTVLKIN
jgi:hypothetical protein